jgi:signal transduction histidine kinase
MQPDVQLDIARYYTDHNRLDEAETYYDSALTLFRSFRNKLGEAKVGLGYGRIFLKKGLLKEANQKFNEVLTVAEELNARSIQISVLEELSKLEESRGDFRKSLSYFKQYNSLHDSLFSRELLDQTFKYQLQFLVDTKDNEIDALNQVNELRQAEISRQHLLRNVIIVVFLLTIGLLYLVYRSNRRKQQLNNLLLAHQSELERRSLELEELNKLKDKFFSIISHDLRSPINSLAGVLNLMEKNGVSPQELPELTRELRLQFNHTKNLITNLLSWAMLQMDKIAIKMESLDLRRLVDENFVLASSMTSKQMNLVNDVDAGTMIFADQNMFNLIIRNLVMNAIKFTEPGGQVRVSSEARGSDVIVMVEDTGIGISPEVQKILMSKENSNYTTRGTMNEKGTGLGISLCKEFIERNNGRMWLVSTVNKGTTFFVSVPKSAK